MPATEISRALRSCRGILIAFVLIIIAGAARLSRRVASVLVQSVGDAYGWPEDDVPAEVEEDVILSRLLALNTERSSG